MRARQGHWACHRRTSKARPLAKLTRPLATGKPSRQAQWPSSRARPVALPVAKLARLRPLGKATVLNRASPLGLPVGLKRAERARQKYLSGIFNLSLENERLAVSSGQWARVRGGSDRARQGQWTSATGLALTDQPRPLGLTMPVA